MKENLINVQMSEEFYNEKFLKMEGAGAKSTMEYVTFNAETDLETYGEILEILAYLVKFPTKIETISVMFTSNETVEDAIAFAIDTGAVVDFMGSRKSIKDHALSIGADISLLPHITKEEFYKLPAALRIHSYYKPDDTARQEDMKFAFDTLWAIWERDGVEGQNLAITIPNADIGSITKINRNGGTSVLNLTSILGGTSTNEGVIYTQMQFNNDSVIFSKTEILDTGEIIYEYQEMS